MKNWLTTLLETTTACVLLFVLCGVGWMVLAAYWPGLFTVAAPEVEVAVMLLLLAAALLLVSAVALVHTS